MSSCWKSSSYSRAQSVLCSNMIASLLCSQSSDEIQLSLRTAMACLALQKRSFQNGLSTRLRKPLQINLTVLKFSPTDWILSQNSLELLAKAFQICTFMQYISYAQNMLNKKNMQTLTRGRSRRANLYFFRVLELEL